MSETVVARDLSVFHVTGPEALDFLHRISTQHVRSMQVGDCRPCALLTAGGGVRSLFHLVRETDDRLLILISNGWAASLLKILDSFHFGEKLEFGPIELVGWELRGEEVPDFQSIRIFPLVNWGISGWAALATAQESQAVLEKIGGPSRSVSENDFGFLRTQFGFSDDPTEISEGNIILEAPLLDFVHRNKGCYPGQEVVERIFTYGNVAKQIIPVKIVPGKPGALVGPQRIFEGENAVGELLKTYESNSQVMGFACVKRLALKTNEKHWTLESGEEVHTLDTRHNPS